MTKFTLEDKLWAVKEYEKENYHFGISGNSLVLVINN